MHHVEENLYYRLLEMLDSADGFCLLFVSQPLHEQRVLVLLSVRGLNCLSACMSAHLMMRLERAPHAQRDDVFSQSILSSVQDPFHKRTPAPV